MARREAARAMRRSGAEPVVARSALKVRLPLAVFGLVVMTVGATTALAWDAPPLDVIVLGVACAMLAVVAVIDIFVVLIHLHTGRRQSSRRDARSGGGEH